VAGRINDEDVKAVRDAVPIDAVVSEYLQLRNAGGGNLKGLCPFHDEKSPSFQVSPSKGLFHCFGCQEGGDTITFVMKVDHLSFSEAVERLAAQAGITLRYEEGGYNPSHQRGERIRLVEAHKIAAEWYAEQLATGPEAETGRIFLAERGFDQAAAVHFGVGYSPQGWDHLTRYLRGKGFTDKELILSGLSQEGRRGPIDRFRGRLMWPIRDIGGDVVGFGARKLYEADNGPKYLNTPETAIYKKSQVLYGIDLAKKEIAKTSRAVVVEGYTDVMACHLAGVTTAIATCGTAFGSEHIKILRRLLMDNGSARVIFTFDGDAAAIDWFFANVEGTPVIAEASIGPYRCNGSRISSATGLPTIIGWERHEQQQRYPDTLPARVSDVRTLYTSTDLDEKASILRRYNVEYVVVADLERIYPLANNECTPTGSEEGIAAFDAMLGTTLEVAHSAQGTTIYRVLPVHGQGDPS